jgi:hypothetical protein
MDTIIPIVRPARIEEDDLIIESCSEGQREACKAGQKHFAVVDVLQARSG